MKKKLYDCVWYWVGDRVTGEWHRGDAGTRAAWEQAGHVAHDGSTRIGAPEGPPSEEQFRRLGPGV
jgi:hypothetical protein